MSIAQHRIAQPQRGFAVERPARQVFGHALDEPQRLAGVAAVRARDVELKRVDDLVAEHAIGLRHRRRERHGDAAARRIGDAADRIRQQAGHDVGLRELGLAAVEHERLASGELVIEQRREARVPALGQLGGDARGAFFARVVIDVEVLGRENPEIEVDDTRPCCGRNTARRATMRSAAHRQLTRRTYGSHLYLSRSNS